MKNQNENSTIEQARALVSKRQTLGLPCFGIVLNSAKSGQANYIEEADFAANGVDTSGPMKLLVRTSWGNGGDDSKDVPDHGAFVNVAMELNSLATAPSVYDAIARMISYEKPGIDDAAVNAAINRIPGATAAREKVLREWVTPASAEKEPPPVDPGPPARKVVKRGPAARTKR